MREAEILHPQARPPVLAVVACLALLAAHAVIAWTAVRSHGSTADEPVHAFSAWLITHQGDYRTDPQQPPLWKRWAAFGESGAIQKIDHDNPLQQRVWDAPALTPDWWVHSLYRTAGNDGEHLVARMRLNLLAVSVVLGAAIAWAAWHFAGEFTAVMATGLYALDPNVLGHAALMKNDLCLALAIHAAAIGTGLTLRRSTLANVAALAGACGLAVMCKFSGIFIYAFVLLLLGTRAMMAAEWQVFGKTLTRRPARFAAATAIFGLILLAGWSIVWLSYGCRYHASPDETSAEFHLLPEAFYRGLIYLWQSDTQRRFYFLGQCTSVRNWAYFPVTFLCKTPLATLIVLMIAAFAIARRARLFRTQRWELMGYFGITSAFAALTLAGAPDQGIRFLFPVYPALMIVGGAALARLVNTRRRRGGVLIIALGLGLLAESVGAFPNYISFFDVATRSHGQALLGDSNLDWGQDLPALRDWQQAHPERKLYLCYFGAVDPHFYHLRYAPLAGSFPYGESWSPIDTPGTIAISVTNWQGIPSPRFADVYARLRQARPREIVGGSIYLYDSEQLR